MLPAYGQQKIWQQYTVEDGLPTMNAWSIIQARDGLLWFSSDKGIFSFDGYDFRQPVDTSIYKGAEAFFPAEDLHGRIWFSRMDKTVWYIEEDTVRAWKYNAMLEDLRKDFFLISQIAFDDNGDTWLHAGGLGFMVFDSTGNQLTIRGSENCNLLMGYVGNQILCGYQNERQSGQNTPYTHLNFILLGDNTMKVVGTAEVKRPDNLSVFSSIGASHEALYLKCEDRVYAWRNGDFLHVANIGLPLSRMAVSTKGNFVFTSEDVEHAGLYYGPTVDDVQISRLKNILPSIRTHYAFFDRDGGLWVSTLSDGLFYCKDPELDVFNLSSTASPKDVFVLAFDGNRKLYAGVETHALSVDIVSGNISVISPVGLVNSWTAMFFEPVSQELWASSTLQKFQSNFWKPVLYHSWTTSGKQHVNAKTISPSPDGKRLWMSSTFGFYELEINTSAVRHHTGDSLMGQILRTYDIMEDNTGRIWVATIQGLKCWNTNQYVPSPFVHESLQFNAISLLLLPDGSVAIGTQGGGILIYHDTKPLIHLSSEQGLTSDYINSLRKGTNSSFLACTDEGLNSIQLDPGRNFRIRRISRMNGLPSNVIHDAIRIGEKLWIATDKGLVHCKENWDTIAMPAPDLKGIRVNKKIMEPLPNMVLSHEENQVELMFHVTSFRSEGKVNYRYRLLEADTAFRTTTARRVEFPELTSGHYRFEVQAQSDNGTWSKSATLEFTILPPWWRTWWFMACSILALGAGIIIFLRAKSNALKEKAEVSLKIKELELSALRAQINPHFIFNCLGSIQQFIVTNNPESATRYLARFAKLVRLSLHSSVDGKHSLADEIALLDNYLALEQMRFRDKFAYSIITPAALDTENVFLPSMLLQPFVENAVLHGLKELKGEGRITIEFTPKDHSIQVIITDNGPGISLESNGDTNGHKSVGMSLTHKRLDLITGHREFQGISRHNLLDPEGRVVGFEVIVEIPVK